jgi:hypothetical protein
MAKMYKVRVRNISSLQSKIKRLTWDIQAAAIKGLRSLAEPIKSDTQSTIRGGSRSGKIVTRYNPKRRHQASAPGEVPANDLGLLASSINAEVDPRQFNLEISAAAAYAKDLELGNRNMLPRPFMVPALNRWRAKIIDTLHDAIRKGI